MKTQKHYVWLFSNLYGYVLGWAWLAPVHHIFLNLSLHALGYDNARFTGEKWFVKRVLARSDVRVAVDIGANVGHYTELLAAHLPATIYAIEPASASFKELQKVAAASGGKVTAINAAVADQDGTGVLYSRHELSEKASLDREPGEHSLLQETVPIRTIDSIIAEQALTRVDFIKIDTEGHELEVMRGMQKTLLHFKPLYIQFEYNHVHLYKGTSLYELSKQLPGYTFYRLLPHGWTLIDPTKQSSNVYMFCNIVAKRK